MKKWLYELIYRLVPVDWIFGPTSQIEHFIDLVINNKIEAGSAITLGCGVGRETIYLAERDFRLLGWISLQQPFKKPVSGRKQ